MSMLPPGERVEAHKDVMKSPSRDERTHLIFGIGLKCDSLYFEID